jgi:probable O-glycosylation ligase (exosortase A-associated)
MRGILLLLIILGSVPVCLVSPYYGVIMWYWISYFNPHRFTYGFTYNLPVAFLIAVPTLLGLLFTKKSVRSLLAVESLLLFSLWAWYTVTYLHAQTVPLFAANMADAEYEISHMSKILLMTFVMILVLTTKDRLRNVLLVSAGSLGLLALRGTLFGMRTSGEARVWGPPDSFLSDNNGFALALNVCLPLLFFLARDEKRRWLRYFLYGLFLCGVVSVVLTYSRGGLVGLGVVLTAIILRSRHKVLGSALLVGAALLVMALAPGAWMERMDRFMRGDLDQTANQRLVAWETAWRFSKDYPLMGGGFNVLPNPNVFLRYEPRPLPGDLISCGPHSIYFQLLADQGYVGLGLFLGLVGSCFWTLFNLRRKVRYVPSAAWIVSYSAMLEIGLLAFMISGAFLGFVYLDLIYQIIGTVVVLKVLFRQEVAAQLAREPEIRRSSIDVLQPQAAAV